MHLRTTSRGARPKLHPDSADGVLLFSSTGIELLGGSGARTPTTQNSQRVPDVPCTRIARTDAREPDTLWRVNGELANLVALALYGTAWLEESNAPPPDLEHTNSTFQYVNSFDVEPPPRQWRRAEASMDSSTWLHWLNGHGVDRLWLVLPAQAPGPLAPRISAAFSNGGQWALLATGRKPSVWVPHWDVGDQHAADDRIWKVRLVGAWADGVTPQQPSIGSTLVGLTTALEQAASLAREQGLDFWAARFADAIERAGADEPDIPYHPDLAPRPPVTRAASQLLAAAAESMVFGGMGSWNDVWLEDVGARTRYETVSSELYQSVLNAFVAATNGPFERAGSGSTCSPERS